MGRKWVSAEKNVDSKRKQISGGCRELHDEELDNLYS
jgi:hypothetical protein